MSQFETDMELSLRRQPDVDAIYRDLFFVEKITRFLKESRWHVLDKLFGIDAVIRLDLGLMFTSQEKVRDFDCYNAGYRDFTLEYMSNSWGTKGEYFHLCADLYFYAWENREQTGFAEVKLFYVAPVKRAIAEGRLVGSLIENTDHSTASFYAYPFSQFKKGWFLYEA